MLTRPLTIYRNESMAKWTTCRCRTHCTSFNSQTGRYEGPGVFLPTSTARRHAQEDARIKTRDNLAENTASRVFDDLPIPTGRASHPHTYPAASTIASSGYHNDPFYVELFTLESEIGDRISWTPADKRLVFSEKDRKSTRLNSSHPSISRMPSSA